MFWVGSTLDPEKKVGSIVPTLGLSLIFKETLGLAHLVVRSYSPVPEQNAAIDSMKIPIMHEGFAICMKSCNIYSLSL